jgi:hypothetical protein
MWCIFIILNSMFIWETVHSEMVEWIEFMSLTYAIFMCIYVLPEACPESKFLLGSVINIIV